MTTFRFYTPIQIRYSDLDTQWHVNNVRFATFLEQGRMAYMIELGLFDGESFHDLDMIVADVHINYLAPILLNQEIQVGVRISKLGNKSFIFEYQIEDRHTRKVLATSETVMVSYDYHQKMSKPLSDHWREVISNYERIPPGP